ncbi:MAG: DUF2147 domain-containing protein [Bacteroidota bacterium]
MKLHFIMMLSFMNLFSTSPSDAIVGQYWSEDKSGKIAVFKCENKYCGKIIWQKENRKDTENPDKKMRNRDIIGLQFLNDFSYDADEKEWIGGNVYSIDNGNTYEGKMWLEDNGKILKMRGFVGISLMGKTATFKRAN